MNNILSFTRSRPRALAVAARPADRLTRAASGVRFIAGEEVLLLSLSLPKLSALRRHSAAAFAVEEHIARPLEDVVVAIGPELSPNRWLVGVVARTALPADHGPGQRILPDTLTVPVPPSGGWAVLEAQDRVLIRLPDGTGLATRTRDLALLYEIAGRPEITLYGGQIDLDHIPAVLPPVTLPARFDLAERQGAGFAVPPLARRLIAILALTAVGHLAILSADTLTLSRHYAAHAAQLRKAAGAPADAAVDDLLARVLAPAPEAPDAGFLPLLAGAFSALAGTTEGISLRDLRYGAAQNSLALTFQAADLGTLQQVETGLVDAGFSVSAGPATSAGGIAEQQMTLLKPRS